MLRDLVIRLFPLPPPEKRKQWPILPLFIFQSSGLRLERNGDYLCYLAAAVTLLIELSLLAVMFLDIVLKTDLLIDASSLRERPILFLEVFVKIMCKLALPLLVLFYLRLRLSIDIKDDPIPFLLNRTALTGRRQRRWVGASLFMVVMGVGILFFPQLSLVWFLEHYGLQDSLAGIVLAQCLEVAGIALFMSLTLSCALILEKAIRFFPQAQEDLLKK